MNAGAAHGPARDRQVRSPGRRGVRLAWHRAQRRKRGFHERRGTGAAGPSKAIMDAFVRAGTDAKEKIAILTFVAAVSARPEQGRNGLDEINLDCRCFRIWWRCIGIDPSVVRGLEYYTGPVYEVELTFPIADEHGNPVRFGSVAGGGRYDGLIARFRGEPVPATGFSIGVSRLLAALNIRQDREQARAGTGGGHGIPRRAAR